MLARRQKIITPSEVDALAVAEILDVPVFWSSVASGCAHFKAYNVTIPEPVSIAGREVAIDPVANPVAGTPHTNGLADFRPSVIVDLNVALVVQDALRLRFSRKGQEKKARKPGEAAQIDQFEAHI